MQIITSKLKGKSFKITGEAFRFESDNECKEKFAEIEKYHDEKGRFKLELTDNEHKVVNTVIISAELAAQISDNKLC
jgi:hypothetical protein